MTKQCNNNNKKEHYSILGTIITKNAMTNTVEKEYSNKVRHESLTILIEMSIKNNLVIWSITIKLILY